MILEYRLFFNVSFKDFQNILKHFLNALNNILKKKLFRNTSKHMLKKYLKQLYRH